MMSSIFARAFGIPMGAASVIISTFKTAVIGPCVRAIIGVAATLPPEQLALHPSLNLAKWRRGGLPPRIGGWALGCSTVQGITLGKTVFLAPDAQLSPVFLLHELAHVNQFARVSNFAVRYLWASLRHGYYANRYESEANDFAASQLSRPTSGA